MALSNTQSELTALEWGFHALGSGLDCKAYAGAVGRARTTVQREVYAAEVASSVPISGHALASQVTQLAEIHAAPKGLWPALVAELVAKDWSAEIEAMADAMRLCVEE